MFDLSIALYIYERFLVFGQEVKLIWRRKLTIPTIVYIMMHMSTVASLCTSVALLAVTGCEVSCPLNKKHGVFNCVNRGTAPFNIFGTYWSRSKLVTGSGFILALAETASSILFRWTIGGSEVTRSQASYDSWTPPRSNLGTARLRQQRPSVGATHCHCIPFLGIHLI